MKTKRKTFLAALTAFVAAPFARGKSEEKTMPYPWMMTPEEVWRETARLTDREKVEKTAANRALRFKADEMREMLEVHGRHGNWNYDSYMHGLYNGMEYMQAMVEDREPDFRGPPEKWLSEDRKDERLEARVVSI